MKKPIPRGRYLGKRVGGLACPVRFQYGRISCGQRQAAQARGSQSFSPASATLRRGFLLHEVLRSRRPTPKGEIAMAESEKLALNATGTELLIEALTMKGAARRATDLALSPMTGKTPKRYGIRIASGATTANWTR